MKGCLMLDDVFSQPVTPDWEGLLRCLRRAGTPARVHNIELFLDAEIKQEIGRSFHLYEGLNSATADFALQYEVRLQRFLGYDYVRAGLDGIAWSFVRQQAEDSAGLQRAGGRSFVDQHRGPITCWEEFESYPWPDPAQWGTGTLEWLQRHLPDDMCVIGSGGFAHFAEHFSG